MHTRYDELLQAIGEDILNVMLDKNLPYFREYMKDTLNISYELLDEAHDLLVDKGLLIPYQALYGVVEDLPIKEKEKRGVFFPRYEINEFEKVPSPYKR